MKTFIWICAGLCFLIWSLMCWAAYGLIDVASSFANGTSDVFTSLVPGIEPLLRWTIDLVDDVGELFLFVLWGAVSGLILIGAWISERILTPATQGFLKPPPLYAPTDTEYYPDASRGDAEEITARTFERLSRRGVKNLKRDPGQDHWRAS